MKKERRKQIIEEAKQTDYDKNGNAIVAVGLKSKEDFYDKYCDKSYKLLNTEMLDYICKYAKSLPPTDNLAINIYTENPTTTNDKKQMKEAIQRQYAEELISARKRLNFNFVTSLIWTILGLLVLAVAIYFEKINLSSILSNTIMIVAWVFLWEAVDKFFLQRPRLRYERNLAHRLMNSEITIKKYK